MSGAEPIRVLVIDDSAFSRQTITRIIERSPSARVVGVARDGEEALRKSLALRPDLVTLDLEMPRMDGFTFLRLLMAKRPTPVLVVSGRREAQDVFQALELGAADFIAKPVPHAAPELECIEHELLRKLHGLRGLRLDRLSAQLAAPPARPRARRAAPGAGQRLVVVGASTGGPAAIGRMLAALPARPGFAVAVAQHMPAGFTASFAERLDRTTPFRAREARDGDGLEPGQLLVAPGGSHLGFRRNAGLVEACLLPRRSSDHTAPSVDLLFESAAEHFGSALVAVVLTGMGDDGARGARAVKRAGGRVFAEAEQSAVIFGMPRQALRTGAVDAALPPERIAALLAGCGPGSLEPQLPHVAAEP